tara:strand:+ start:796 stop:1056 length:261 start_codon:yes stop_codon:yes gene_type:complete
MKKYTMVGNDVSVYAMSPEKAVVRFLKGEHAPLKRRVSFVDSKIIYSFNVTKVKTTNKEKLKHGIKFLYKLKINLVKKAHKELKPM